VHYCELILYIEQPIGLKPRFIFVFLVNNSCISLIEISKAARAISAFRKLNSLVKINSKLNSKPYDYLYLAHVASRGSSKSQSYGAVKLS